ncbi:metabolite traffic protein EboE [Anditalea andensis]|uniref:Xylose isomerase n=1 Tax=Anditalea andensis TaxID=1048983 RepID=A0A074KW77_9BACT|nr:metabolite traffic protein EboE [Anditalea andensis]KEO71873.1 hypothetical protein EL17_20345 [Anditalea andensis]
MFNNGCHITYCTNIHPGESWEDTFASIKAAVPAVKSKVAKGTSFGIGLRLSDKASISLLEKDNLPEFKNWLKEHDCYVFTMNGFPFGEFHHQIVKDQVHHPDWTTPARFDYTSRLFDILAVLLPENIDGGISTSPLSYKYWEAVREDKDRIMHEATMHMVKIAEKLYRINQQTKQVLHLDIEPEPDGLLENTDEVIIWFNDWLMPLGTAYLKQQLDLSSQTAEACLKKHIRLCYDVCHFAIGYEKPEEVFRLLKTNGIQIGKIQISAALKVMLPGKLEERQWVDDALKPFVESTYLHQVVERDAEGQITHYPDLPQALHQLQTTKADEWRIHFHVPVFIQGYGKLASTQEDIVQVLDYIKNERVTNHLEVETYTWEVLPKGIQLDLVASIIREMDWVINIFSNR